MKITLLAVAALVSLAIPIARSAPQAQQPAASGSGTRSRPASSVAHPLDPLNGAEIAAAVRVIQAGDRFPKGALFPIVVLKEPPKDEVLSYSQGAPFRREAFAVVYDRATNKTFEASRT
jgi:Cu2+-containing amine oxidase